MSAKRKHKRPPIALRWNTMILRDDEISSGVVKLVGIALVSYGDADGRNCYPSIETLMHDAKASRRSVLAALVELVERGYLIKETKRRGWYPNRYSTDFPTGAVEHLSDNGYSGAHSGAHSGAVEHLDLRPPNVDEEEEGADAALADARSAAPSAVAGDETDDGIEPWMVATACERISHHAGMSIEPSVAGVALSSVMTRFGWHYEVAAVYCVERLRARARIRGGLSNPSAWLAVTLTNLDGRPESTPRMALAKLIAEMWDLDEQIPYDPRHRPIYEWAAEQLAVEDDEGRSSKPDLSDAWGVKPAKIEAVSEVVQEAIYRGKQWLRQQQQSPPPLAIVPPIVEPPPPSPPPITATVTDEDLFG